MKVGDQVLTGVTAANFQGIFDQDVLEALNDMESIAEIIIRCTPHAILAMDTNLAILQVNDAFCQLFGQPSSSELTGKPAQFHCGCHPLLHLDGGGKPGGLHLPPPDAL